MKRARLLKDGQAVEVDASGGILRLPAAMRDEVDTVIVLDASRM